MSTKRLESLTRKYLPAPAARLAKRFAVRPRYQKQAKACRKGFEEFGDRYPHPVLFIAGLPKSGTTWLERMVSSYPGFHDLLIPDVARHELATGGSHDYELPEDMFSRFDRMLVLTKMHVHGSEHNVRLLREANVPYVVLHRDLRDVAVSHHFYVRQTPWHPEYPLYQGRSVEQGLAVFAERTLRPFMAWVRSWHQRVDPELGMELRYEDLLADTIRLFTQVASHFGLDCELKTVERIVQEHSFTKLSEGRKQGEQSDRSFFRKGVSGDWRNHFTPPLVASYKSILGDFLIEFGYEQDHNW